AIVHSLNGWGGVTLVDLLDTMLILGLHDVFEQARQHEKTAPFFETVIRYLGGFLSAYALSGEPIMLAKAEELGLKLLPVFNTTSGLPIYGVNTVT
ncbi:glycoside hydrolase family 47 protein, partial [Sphaerobolus stellatus SS14]